ncbi:hypothetical protein B0T20DRAFT_416033 [Sordaria brevicollis]|uniref:Uncharacterized protein n=1 Tax=Sordaria brevicollis TaxID=83679 RepID=A0AAE0UAY3_SORBR|nr:hypothetical protein B0T20DRAFT_416033 [Sordaria brevicollis]
MGILGTVCEFAQFFFFLWVEVFPSSCGLALALALGCYILPCALRCAPDVPAPAECPLHHSVSGPAPSERGRRTADVW